VIGLISTPHFRQERIRTLFSRSQISYANYYGSLYSAFNCWYRSVTGSRQDTTALQALTSVQPSFVQSMNRDTLSLLRPYMYRLYAATHLRPIPISQWSGQLNSVDDFEGLVWFWYAVRCCVVHGEAPQNDAVFEYYVKLAFETLQICMTAILATSYEAS
jgi:hypothetical protein